VNEGVDIPLGDKVQAAKFTLRGEVHPCKPVAKLRMALCATGDISDGVMLLA
jgi:hypothetical protein